MPFFVDAPTKVGASAELARYYILECVIDSDGTPRFTVTVTDSYEADEDISLDLNVFSQMSVWLAKDAENDSFGKEEASALAEALLHCADRLEQERSEPLEVVWNAELGEIGRAHV